MGPSFSSSISRSRSTASLVLDAATRCFILNTSALRRFSVSSSRSCCSRRSFRFLRRSASVFPISSMASSASVSCDSSEVFPSSSFDESASIRNLCARSRSYTCSSNNLSSSRSSSSRSTLVGNFCAAAWSTPESIVLFGLNAALSSSACIVRHRRSTSVSALSPGLFAWIVGTCADGALPLFSSSSSRALRTPVTSDHSW
mmetsp:Transcript_12547/g.16590  ORF Transcript_12547/g.16590 Transcript_12547/m.16590 type:complete len:201 (+) Transcript_12547:1606-2208(+)